MKNVWNWLFGGDTPERLARETMSFFDRFKRLQARIEKLLAENVEARSVAQAEHAVKLDTLENNYERMVETEVARYAYVYTGFENSQTSLASSLKLASKVVTFAEEDV